MLVCYRLHNRGLQFQTLGGTEQATASSDRLSLSLPLCQVNLAAACFAGIATEESKEKERRKQGPDKHAVGRQAPTKVSREP